MLVLGVLLGCAGKIKGNETVDTPYKENTILETIDLSKKIWTGV